MICMKKVCSLLCPKRRKKLCPLQIRKPHMTSNGEIIIKSLAEYIKTVPTMTEDFKSNSEDIIVYRGQGRADQELIPYLFRSGYENIRQNEARLLREAEAAHPEEFSGLTTLDKLAKLQHYGFPTRLLDVTLNPLVALYFSVRVTEKTDNSNFDGSVILCRVPANSVEMFDSELVVAMANLANLSDEEKDLLEHCDPTEIRIIHHANNITTNKRNNSNSDNKTPAKDTPQTQGSSTGEKPQSLSEKEPTHSGEDEQVDTEQKQAKLLEYKAATKFMGLIKAELPYFEESLEEFFRESFIRDRMYRPVYVKTRQLNARLAAQNGAFLLFGISDKPKHFEQKKIIVSKSAKDTIRKELISIGINEAALFPELDKFLEHLQNISK